MKTITFKQLIDQVEQLRRNERPWHFHMLGETCKYNENPGQFSILVEDEQGGNILRCQFTEKPLTQTEQLSRLWYGQDFLQSERVGEENSSFGEILRRIENYTEQGIPWHHHHFPPNCLLSEHKQNHCIAFEDPLTAELLVAVYDWNPTMDLGRVERLFFKDLYQE